MLKVIKGFIIDEAKTALSPDQIVFTKGQIIDTITDIIHVRNSPLLIPKQNGEFYVFYNPFKEVPIVRNTTDTDVMREAYIGMILIDASGNITVTYPNNGGGNTINIISSEHGVTHAETVVVNNGSITLGHLPNVIVEIYVEGFGFIDVQDNLIINNNVVSFGTNDLDGYTIRIVYES